MLTLGCERIGSPKKPAASLACACATLPEPTNDCLGWGSNHQETASLPPRNLLAGFPSSALLPTFLGEGFPTKIDYRKKGTLILTSLLEDLVGDSHLVGDDLLE